MLSIGGTFCSRWAGARISMRVQGRIGAHGDFHRGGPSPFWASRKSENRKVKSRVGFPRAPLAPVVKRNVRSRPKSPRGALRTEGSLYIREVLSPPLSKRFGNLARGVFKQGSVAVRPPVSATTSLVFVGKESDGFVADRYRHLGCHGDYRVRSWFERPSSGTEPSRPRTARTPHSKPI